MLPNWFNDYRNFIEENIEIYISNYLNVKVSKPLEDFKEIILYSLEGGKKIRAILALEFYLVLSGKKLSDLKKEIKNGKTPDILKFCIAIESIHAYSLIHDDLPCMDNDILRRGKATVWSKFGEYRGVLVGDLLNSLSFEILSEISDSRLSQKLTKLLSSSVGFFGMLGGQVEDLYFENKFSELDIKILEKLHNKKTGALIKASVLGGVILSKNKISEQTSSQPLEKTSALTPPSTGMTMSLLLLGEGYNKERYKNFGEKLGLAFQVKDDLLDIEGTVEETGKSIGGENKGYVYFLGVKKSKEKLSNLISECRELSKNLSSSKIDFIVDYIESRKK